MTRIIKHLIAFAVGVLAAMTLYYVHQYYFKY